MKAVIMAGGLGERLAPLTQIIPKPLLPLGESSVLEFTISKLKEQGFKEIILAVNYKSDLFERYLGDGSKYGLKIHYSKEKEKLGTGGPLKLVRDKLTEPFLVINGDILTNLNFNELKKFHSDNRAVLTTVSKVMELPMNYGIVRKTGNELHSIEEKPIISHEINAGIYFVSPEAVDEIPENKFFTMVDLIKKLKNNNKKVCAYTLKDYWLDIGHMKDYEKAQKDIKDGLLSVNGNGMNGDEEMINSWGERIK